ncbi:MAG: hypothetical protein NUV46_01225 [Nanoarchaeota archaeon]|nr:hypothetical protein [Nanoarchaeota archaeon]
MEVKYYKIKIDPLDKKVIKSAQCKVEVLHEKSDRYFNVGDYGYLLTIEESNVGNNPQVYREVKTLAQKLIETGEVSPNKKFTIKIKQ